MQNVTVSCQIAIFQMKLNSAAYGQRDKYIKHLKSFLHCQSFHTAQLSPIIFEIVYLPVTVHVSSIIAIVCSIVQDKVQDIPIHLELSSVKVVHKHGYKVALLLVVSLSSRTWHLVCQSTL